MPRYIDADELPKVKFHPLPYTHIVPSDLKGLQTDAYERGWNDAIDAIVENAETADVVEQKTGRWIEDSLVCTSGYSYGVLRCSICEAYYERVGFWPHRYCPSCGAKMEDGDG